MPTQNKNNPVETPETADDQRGDRSFDTIADHFEKKVYGGLKGDIRLAVLRRDIFDYVEQMSQTLGRPLRILDVGAGLAQIAIELASQGHSMVINDISANMLEKAKQSAEHAQAMANICWYVCPYQQLETEFSADNFGTNLRKYMRKTYQLPCASYPVGTGKVVLVIGGKSQ